MQAVAIPELLKDRPTYGGFPVPYSVVVDINGIPDFKAADMQKWAECVVKRLCALCGQKLPYWVWYIGGPSCADQGIYFDLAMHEECAFYAAAVCPFLAQGRDYVENPKAPAGFVSRVNLAVEKADVLYASKRRRDQMEIVRNGDAGLVVKTGPEAKRVQIWPKVPA